MNQVDHFLWEEKYRPKTLSEYVCNDDVRTKLQTYITDKQISHLILAGSPGIGKTTLAKMLVNELGCQSLYINCSDETSIEIVRDKIKRFAASSTLGSIKIVICDEADGLSKAAQRSLKGIIEQYSYKTRFIFTTNNIDQIDDAILSRCTRLEIEHVSKDYTNTWLSDILNKENIKYTSTTVKSIVNLYYPDLREILRMTRELVEDGVLQEDKNRVTLLAFNKLLFSTLKESSTKHKKWQTIYDFLTSNNITNYELIFKLLFSRIMVFNESRRPQITIMLAEYLKWMPTIPDKFINTMAMISELLNILESNE